MSKVATGFSCTLLVAALALFVLSGALNQFYQTSSYDTLAIKNRQDHWGAYQLCSTGVYRLVVNNGAINTNTDATTECHTIDLNCQVTLDDGSTANAFPNASSNACTQFNAFRALLALSCLSALIATIVVFLGIFFNGKCTRAFAISTGFLCSLSGMVAMALFIDLAKTKNIFSERTFGDYQYCFWLLVAAWPLALISCSIQVNKFKNKN